MRSVCGGGEVITSKRAWAGSYLAPKSNKEMNIVERLFVTLSEKIKV